MVNISILNTWQRGPEVLIQVYQYEDFHKELKLSTLSVTSIEPMNICMPTIKSRNSEEPVDIDDLEDLLRERETQKYL